jgi:biopolymer transport protein ExbD
MGGGGGHEPNLTPLIDLFSVLIVFLLLTAAWTQLESFQVTINEKPKLNPDMESFTPPPEDKEEKKKKLTIEIHSQHLIAKEDETQTQFSFQGSNIENGFKSLLEQWKARSEPNQQVAVQSEAGSTYGQMIQVYDFLQLTGWDNIAISPY